MTGPVPPSTQHFEVHNTPSQSFVRSCFLASASAWPSLLCPEWAVLLEQLWYRKGDCDTLIMGGQRLGRESHTTHIPHALPAQLVPTPHAQGTHTELWELPCEMESSVLPIPHCFWSLGSSHRACSATPTTFPMYLTPQSQVGGGEDVSLFLSCQLL